MKGRLLFLKLQNKVWSHDEISEYADDPNKLDDMLNEDLGLPIILILKTMLTVIIPKPIVFLVM